MIIAIHDTDPQWRHDMRRALGVRSPRSGRSKQGFSGTASQPALTTPLTARAGMVRERVHALIQIFDQLIQMESESDDDIGTIVGSN